jgi:epoxyqueuosine reductase
MEMEMDLKRRLRERALELGFSSVGFTHAEPLDLYIQEIDSRPPEMYGWTVTDSFDLRKSAQIKEKYPWARSLLILIRNYHKYRFPQALTGKIGRCYQVDERIEKKSEYERMKAYLAFLKGAGIRSRFDFAIPARMAAARAGLVTYGKNCFAYARGVMREASWIEIIPLVLDVVIEPDEPSISYGCPSWCRNTCLAACPTRALYAPGKMNPLHCIAYLSFYSEGITPLEFREPMGAWVYGCDRCQQVCPRNEAYINQELPISDPLERRAGDFRLDTLLTMTDEHYINKVWPLCFYISRKNKAKWQMNAARALGNLKDHHFVPVLAEALSGNPSEMVRGMCAWALGRIGGRPARQALEFRLKKEIGLVRQEIEMALSSET